MLLSVAANRAPAALLPATAYPSRLPLPAGCFSACDCPLCRFARFTQERLRSSGVGKYVMLLSKHSDESLPNKKRCLALIEKWMRPVYKKSIEYTSTAQLARPRAPGERTRPPLPPAVGGGGGGAGSGRDILEEERAPKPGEAGFRYHASIPEALPMDFKLMPQSSAVPKASKKYEKESVKGKLTGKFLAIKRGLNAKRSQAESISIEGRSL